MYHPIGRIKHPSIAWFICRSSTNPLTRARSLKVDLLRWPVVLSDLAAVSDHSGFLWDNPGDTASCWYPWAACAAYPPVH